MPVGSWIVRQLSWSGGTRRRSPSEKKRRSISCSTGMEGAPIVGGVKVKGGPTTAEGLPRPKPGIGRDARDEDPWRVENVVENGHPPVDADWWIDDDGDGDGDGDVDSEAREDTSMKEAGPGDDSSAEPRPSPRPDGVFRNCGLSTWEKSRAAWRNPPPETGDGDGDSAGQNGGRAAARRQPPPPVRYDDVVRGLTQVSRTFELPGRMTLPDIVDVFVDIWECEKDY